jgi:hypothetical protein
MWSFWENVTLAEFEHIFDLISGYSKAFTDLKMPEKSSKKLKMTSNGAKNDQEGHVIIFEKNVVLVKKIFSTSSALSFLSQIEPPGLIIQWNIMYKLHIDPFQHPGEFSIQSGPSLRPQLLLEDELGPKKCKNRRKSALRTHVTVEIELLGRVVY